MQQTGAWQLRHSRLLQCHQVGAPQRGRRGATGAFFLRAAAAGARWLLCAGATAMEVLQKRGQQAGKLLSQYP